MTRRLTARLASLTPAEARWRTATAGHRLWQRARTSIGGSRWHRGDLRHALRAGAPALDAARASDWAGAHRALSLALQMDPPRFPIGPSLRESVRARLAAYAPAAPTQARARAERVLQGRFDLLGYDDLRFDAPNGAAPDWHLDPVHARRAPRGFWSAVPFLDPQCGDHKVIWELNRQQHLLTLGRAYWLTGDERYRRVAVDHLVDWIVQNPPLIGINWASMLELGFRSISWLWAMHFFARADPASDERPWLVDVVLALDRQLRHIERNLSYYFSPNTHLLGEALALYVAGRSLTWLARSERYADTGRDILLQEVARQIGADGGHLERSMHYQRYTLDFYVLALVMARVTGDPAAPAFEAAVDRLRDATRLLADDRGWLPHIGDDDGGQLFPIAGRAADDASPSLWIAGALTGRPGGDAADVPEEALWMLAHPVLETALHPALRASRQEQISSGALPDTGYYVSRGSDSTHLVFDAGAHGFANGGHAHADALSFTLSVRGVPLFIDTGTGSYTADPAARDRFRSTALHNTVTVDGRSQSVPAGPFHWTHTAHARAERWRTTPAFDYVEGLHDGYAPVTHTRHLLLVHGDLLIVADRLGGEGTHRLDAHWHLAPRWEPRFAGRRVELHGPERLTWATTSDHVALVADGNTTGAGCWSPVYGRIEPIAAFTGTTQGRLPLWTVSALSLTPDNDVLAVATVDLRPQAARHGVAVRIVRSHGVDLFVVCPHGSAGTSSPPRWQTAGITSDAHMLFTRIAGRGGRLAVVDAHYVRHEGCRLEQQFPAGQAAFHTAITSPGRVRPREHIDSSVTEVR